MAKIDQYREILRQEQDWDAFLMQESGLPGPRGNLELAHAVAAEGDRSVFEHLLAFLPQAVENSPEVFLGFCGILGLGELLAQGEKQHSSRLRELASDPRWRVREAVATALQRLGRQDIAALLEEMRLWSQGNPLEKRAAAAALCEPDLLKESRSAAIVLEILDEITASLPSLDDRKSEAYISLRKGLGYCWSVAVAALPEAGKPLMEKWLSSQDADVRWIMRENLKKNRLVKMDSAWVHHWQAKTQPVSG